MDIISTFAVIAGIVFLGFIAEIIFKKTNIPDVLFLIIIGILIGNYLKWVDSASFGEGSKLFGTFALIFVLFQGALSIDFKALIRSLRNTLVLTVLSFASTLIIIGLISYLLGYDLIIALLIGTILAGTSSAVVIPLVRNVDIRDKYSLILTLESAISDVLCIIGTVTILEIMDTGNVVASQIFQQILSSFSLAIVVGVVVGLIWVLLLSKFEIFTNSYMLTIALVVGLYALVESNFVKASGPIAALAFGLVMGNSKGILTFENKREKAGKILNRDKLVNKSQIRNVLSPSAKNFYQEISFFVKTFFFVYLGILIDFSNPYVFFYGVILTLGIFLVRPLIVKLVFGKQKLDRSELVILEIMVPKGLAAAVLAGIAVQSGLLVGYEAMFVSLILSVVFLSIIFTSTLVFLEDNNMFKGLLPFLHEHKKRKRRY